MTRQEYRRIGSFYWNQNLGMFDIAFSNYTYGGIRPGEQFFVLLKNGYWVRTELVWDGRAWVLRGVGLAVNSCGRLAKI